MKVLAENFSEWFRLITTRPSRHLISRRSPIYAPPTPFERLRPNGDLATWIGKTNAAAFFAIRATGDVASCDKTASAFTRITSSADLADASEFRQIAVADLRQFAGMPRPLSIERCRFCFNADRVVPDQLGVRTICPACQADGNYLGGFKRIGSIEQKGEEYFFDLDLLFAAFRGPWQPQVICAIVPVMRGEDQIKTASLVVASPEMFAVVLPIWNESGNPETLRAKSRSSFSFSE